MPKIVVSLILFLGLIFAFATTAFADNGTCAYIKGPGGGRALPGEDPFHPGYKVSDNKCDDGYKPNLVTIGGTSFTCECIPNDTPVCSVVSSCTANSDCQKNPGCSNYVCVGFIGSRTPGRCEDGATVCAKANANDCTSDADCQAPGGGCLNYYCWKGGKVNSCRYGPSPTRSCYDPKSGQPFDSTKDILCTTSAGMSCQDENKLPIPKTVQTAIGCIHTEPKVFIEDLMKFILGIGGGMAFLLMLIGVFEMITSAGNPERLKSGTDRFTSAIIGILFIVFSILFMQIIGVDILGILPK